MSFWRHILTCMAVLSAVALAGPTLAVAAGGGSAGDQQYVDPLAGHHHPSGSHSSKPSAGSSSPAPSSSGTPSTTSPDPTTSTLASTTTTTPTATTASSTSTTTSRLSKTLPRTGFDAWLSAGLGFVLVAGGFGLRLRARRA